jgi:hypothetical protein
LGTPSRLSPPPPPSSSTSDTPIVLGRHGPDYRAPRMPTAVNNPGRLGVIGGLGTKVQTLKEMISELKQKTKQCQPVICHRPAESHNSAARHKRQMPINTRGRLGGFAAVYHRRRSKAFCLSRRLPRAETACPDSFARRLGTLHMNNGRCHPKPNVHKGPAPLVLMSSLDRCPQTRQAGLMGDVFLKRCFIPRTCHYMQENTTCLQWGHDRQSPVALAAAVRRETKALACKR